MFNILRYYIMMGCIFLHDITVHVSLYQKTGLI